MSVRSLIAVALFSLAFSGCGSMLRDLRGDDFDQELSRSPTSGGMWPERGWLEDTEYDDRSEAVARIQRQAGEYKGDAKRSLAGADGKAGEKAAGMRARKEDFIDQSQASGSLWASDGQTNYFFTRNRIKTVGDIVTVQIEEQMAKDIAAEIKRTLTKSEREYELAMANEERAPASAKDAAAAAETEERRDVTFTDLDLSKNVGVKSGDTLMTEILERYPNGNYKVKGAKKVSYRGNSRLVLFTGVARSSDLDEGDQVASGKFYEYRLNVERPGSAGASQ